MYLYGFFLMYKLKSDYSCVFCSTCVSYLSYPIILIFKLLYQILRKNTSRHVEIIKIGFSGVIRLLIIIAKLSASYDISRMITHIPHVTENYWIRCLAVYWKQIALSLSMLTFGVIVATHVITDDTWLYIKIIYSQ